MRAASKLGAAKLSSVEALMVDTVADPRLWQYRFGKRAQRLNVPQLELANASARELVARWGRRCGKSVYLGENDSPRWSLRRPDTQTWVLAPVQNQANVIFGYLAGILFDTPLEALVKDRGSSPWPWLVFWNDARIDARNLGYDGRNVRGQSGDRLIIDEAAFVKDSTIDEAVSPIIAASRYAEIVKISTPNDLNHFWRSCMDGEPGNDDIRSFHHPTWHNAFIDRKYLLSERRKRSRMAWEVEYGAVFVEDQNAQFPWTLIQACIDPDALWGTAPVIGRKYVIGYDPADVHDRSAVIVIDVTDRPWRVVDRDAIGGYGYKVQEQKLAALSYRWNNAPIHMDLTGHRPLIENLQAITETTIDGHTVPVRLDVTPFIYTNASKYELMEQLKITMEQSDLLMPFDDDIVREMRFFRREVSGGGTIRLNALEGEFDDFVNGLALAVMMAGWQSASRPARFGVY